MSTRKKPWYHDTLYFDVQEFPTCCGIGVVSDFYWVLNDYYRFGTYNDDVQEHNEENLTQRAWSSEIKRMTNRIKIEGYKCFVCTITDENKKTFNFFNRALLSNGWTELTTTKSNHGKYLIHMYERKFIRKRKKK